MLVSIRVYPVGPVSAKPLRFGEAVAESGFARYLVAEAC